VFWKVIIALFQAVLANPQLLNEILANIKEFIELVKRIWGDDGRNVITQTDLEASGLLDGRAGGLIELIKWLIANPDTLRVIIEFLRAIGALKP
jgi:hypothetical protein